MAILKCHAGRFGRSAADTGVCGSRLVPLSGRSAGASSFDGITDPWYNPGDVKGSDTHIQQLNEQERYSWIKAPRWRGHAMEVGPLARTLIAYHKGDAATIESVDRMMSALKLPLSGIQSTLGRILCRAHEAQWAVGKLQYFSTGL